MQCQLHSVCASVQIGTIVYTCHDVDLPGLFKKRQRGRFIASSAIVIPGYARISTNLSRRSGI